MIIWGFHVLKSVFEHADFQAQIMHHQTKNFLAWRLLLRVSHSFSGASRWGGCTGQGLKWTQYSNRHLLECSVDFGCLFPIKTLGSTGIPAQRAQRALFTVFNPCRGVAKGPGSPPLRRTQTQKFIDTSTHADQKACRKHVWRCISSEFKTHFYIFILKELLYLCTDVDFDHLMVSLYMLISSKQKLRSHSSSSKSPVLGPKLDATESSSKA